MYFNVELDDGRVAHCQCVQKQEYKNCSFSAGLVDGAGPDDHYFRLEGRGEPLTLFLREDEMLAMLWVISGTLWSSAICEPSSEQQEESE